MQPRLRSINIKGYRPFGDFSAKFGPLEVIVGANGSGKSSLFEFLRFLRDNMSGEIPPEIIPGSIGQRIFHSPGSEKLLWEVEIDVPQDYLITYRGELMGPVGSPRVISESVWTVPGEILMEIKGKNRLYMQGEDKPLDSPNVLGLSTATNPRQKIVYNLRKYIRGWRFYDSFRVSRDKIRNPVLVEQEPVLQEDAGNLSSVLFYLMSIRPAFDELQQILRSTVPGFKELTVRARGAPGQVIAFWQEEGIEGELVLTDLSDGVLQLICWAVLCVHPNPPSLICIDEPDQGVHPRTLAILAELFRETCERTQVLLATHSSYFLTLFDRSQIAVMRKENGEAKFAKPADSKALVAILDDFGSEEIENLHISDELEILT
jgi:predicted ATPase